MQVECIRFDEVFDVQPRIGVFSFRRQGRATYGVALPGRAVPRAGATCALAFGKPGDWTRVLGWRDLATGRVILRDPPWALALDSLGNLWLLAPPLLALGALTGGQAGLLAALAVVAGITLCVLAYGWRLGRAVRAALMAVPVDRPARCAPGGHGHD